MELDAGARRRGFDAVKEYWPFAVLFSVAGAEVVLALYWLFD